MDERKKERKKKGRKNENILSTQMYDLTLMYGKDYHI